MSYLLDFNEKYIFDIDNLIIGKKINNIDIFKFFIYYNDDNTNLKEIYIKLPIFRLIYNFNTKYKQMSIPIYPLWNKTNQLINFITELEQNIVTFFKNKNKYKNIELSSLIKMKNSLYFIKTNINNINSITSNINKQKIEFNDFKINGEIEMIIKISYVWLKDNKIGISSQLYQIKYYGLPEQLNINFIDKLLSPPLPPPSPPPPPPPLKNNKLEHSEDKLLNSNNIEGTPHIVPTIDQLKKALEKIKNKKNNLLN
jgi:hypothetical protein